MWPDRVKYRVEWLGQTSWKRGKVLFFQVSNITQSKSLERWRSNNRDKCQRY